MAHKIVHMNDHDVSTRDKMDQWAVIREQTGL